MNYQHDNQDERMTIEDWATIVISIGFILAFGFFLTQVIHPLNS